MRDSLLLRSVVDLKRGFLSDFSRVQPLPDRPFAISEANYLLCTEDSEDMYVEKLRTGDHF